MAEAKQFQRPQSAKMVEPSTALYHVYDLKLEIPGARITDKDGVRTVMLTDAQAQYFVDAGVIGDKPMDEHSSEDQDALNQFSRGRMAEKKNKAERGGDREEQHHAPGARRRMPRAATEGSTVKDGTGENK